MELGLSAWVQRMYRIPLLVAPGHRFSFKRNVLQLWDALLQESCVMHMYATGRLNHWSNKAEFMLYQCTLALDFLVLRGLCLTDILEENKTGQPETESFPHWIACWILVGFFFFSERKKICILAISRNYSNHLDVQLGYYCSRYRYPLTLHPRSPNHFERK